VVWYALKKFIITQNKSRERQNLRLSHYKETNQVGMFRLTLFQAAFYLSLILPLDEATDIWVKDKPFCSLSNELARKRKTFLP
jgi:hypothetical protein